MNRQALGTMAELMSLASDTDIMALQEIGQAGETLAHVLSDFFVFVTEAAHGLGTALIIRRHIFSSLQQHHVELPQGATVTAVSCTAETGFRTCFASLYLSPNPQRLTVSASSILRQITATTRSDVILGDFNARHVNWCPSTTSTDSSASHTRGRDVLAWVKEVAWSVANPSGTHRTATRTAAHRTYSHSTPRDTTPDLILSSKRMSVGESHVVMSHTSDHHMVRCSLPGKFAEERSGPDRIAWHRVNPAHTHLYASRLDRALGHTPDPGAPIDTMVHHFVRAMRDASRALPRGNLKNGIPAWNLRIHNLEKNARQLAESRHPGAPAARQEYAEAAQEAYDKWAATRSRTYWDSTARRSPPPSVLISEGKTLSSTEEKLNAFGNVFAAKHASRGEERWQPPTATLPPPVTVHEVEAAIRCHPLGKSSDHDDITAEALRMLTTKAMLQLAEIFTASLESGVVPHTWLGPSSVPS
eukprot:PhM_4_TR15931/c3_g1_i5/m.191